jgi:imidazolonepropionase-like amidohydrolase
MIGVRSAVISAAVAVVACPGCSPATTAQEQTRSGERADQTIVMSDQGIVALGTTGTISPPPKALRVDVSGCTAFPGFVGMHDHLFYSRLATRFIRRAWPNPIS